MVFGPEQVDKIMNIIEKNSLFFLLRRTGKEALSSRDIDFLKSFGINVDKYIGISPIEKAYRFGQLTTILGNRTVQKMHYNDFLNYLESGKWIPLTQAEKTALSLVKRFSYNEVKGLGNKIKKNLGQKIIEYDEKLKNIRQKIIKEKSSEAIELRKSSQWLSSELRKTTKDWERDWGRVSDFVLHSAYSRGAIDGAKRKAEKDKQIAKVYMDVYPGACKHCVSKYLTAGIGSRPIIFLVEKLEENGTNIGRKVNELLAVISPLHPWCRCTTNYFKEGSTWDEKTNRFIEPKYVSKYKPIVTVTINGKEFKG